MGDIAEYLVQNDTNFRRNRLPALYSDFQQQRSVNPDGFRANVTAWTNALERAAWDGRIATGVCAPNRLVISLDDNLDRALEHSQFGRPTALGTVVKEAVSKRALVPVDAFLKWTDGAPQTSWSEFPKNVVGWLLDQVWAAGPGQGTDKLPGGDFILVANVERAARVLADRATKVVSLFDGIYSKELFRQTFRHGLLEGMALSDADLDVLLLFSSRDRNIVSYDGKVIKLKGPTAKDGEGITDEDRAIASLKELMDDMKRRTAPMAAKVNQLAASANEAVSRNNRVAALAALRGKKLTEASLGAHFATLSQLEAVASKIQEAADHVQLVKVMEGSAEVLKRLNLQVGGADKVEEVMANLRQEMSEVDEVGHIVASGASDALALDEAELDDELAEMAAQEKKKKELAEQADREEKEANEAAITASRLAEIASIPLPASEESLQRSVTRVATEGIRKLSLTDESAV